MQRAFFASLAFHFTVVAVAYVGVPMIRRDAPVVETPIVVDVVTVAEVTNAPPPEIAEDPKPVPEKKPPPPPPPRAETPPPPQPEPEPEPEPAPRAEPAPKPKPEKKPVEEAKPAPKPEPPPMLASVKPKRKPKPPSRFASVLRTVEKLKDRPAPPPEEAPEKEKPKAEEPKESFETQVARALSKRRRADFDPTAPLTISEIDLVRQQIAKCWSLPAGAKDAEDLVIEVRVEMNIDGRPQVAQIKDQARMRADPFFRAAAETALRAVLNPRCHPFKLPPEKFDRWRTMTLVFNPKEMFGT